MAKRNAEAVSKRAAGAKPGSIRYEAAQRGISEHAIRVERAAVKNFSVSQARGHARSSKGEYGLQVLKDIQNWDKLSAKKRILTLRLLKKTSKATGLRVGALWTGILYTKVA